MDTLGGRALAASAGVIQRRSGLVFPDTRRDAVARALEQTMSRLGVRDPEQFAILLEQEGAVFDEVMHHLTIGETYFFREPAQFEVLRDLVVPMLRERQRDRELRFWSAACASGEEAYSLAILSRNEGANARVLGTDIDRTRVAAARRGRYREWSMRGLTPEQIDTYFTRDGAEFCLRAELRRSVAFQRLNLVEDAYPVPSTGQGIDVVFCRNVLIYFPGPIIDLVCRRLLDSLSRDGWLFVGASDPPVMHHADCEVVQTRAGLAYRRKDGARRTVPKPLTYVPRVNEAPPVAEIPPIAERVEPVAVTPPPVPAALAAAAPADDAVSVAYALRDYERVVELGTAGFASRTATLHDLALTVRALGNLDRIEQAEKFCTAALERAPESAELHALHAMLLLRAGHARPAAVAARRALYLDRDFAIARITLGDTSRKLGDATAARRAYETALAHLTALDAGSTVPGTEGETRERLMASVRDRLHPLERAS